MNLREDSPIFQSQKNGHAHTKYFSQCVSFTTPPFVTVGLYCSWFQTGDRHCTIHTLEDKIVPKKNQNEILNYDILKVWRQSRGISDSPADG